MKYLIILTFLISYNGLSQNASENLKSRINIDRIKLKPTGYTISNKDTFYFNQQRFKDLSSFKYNKETLPNFLKHYKSSVFFNSKKHSSRVYRLLQWKTPIVIYFDKSIPKKIIKKVKAFYSKIEDIENLSISYTNTIDKANYRIQITDETFNIIPEEFGITKELEKQMFFFTNCSYSIIKDNSNGIVACTLKINRKQLSNNDNILLNLKQGIFFSLGRFHLNYSLNPEESLTSVLYKNSDIMSDLDSSILRLHYYQLYNRHIDGTDFEQLFQIN
nr:hypothetical protein [uncultured Psychroserpens sp.]